MKSESSCIRAISAWAAQSVLVVGALGLAAAGCGQSNVTENQDTAESLALFRDSSTSGPRLDVYDADGFAAIAVSGPIGSESMLTGFKGGDSLVEIYRAVHPEASTIPEDLVALDELVAPQLAALRTVTREPAAAGILPSPTVDKSRSSFNAAVCKKFRESYAQYTPIECNFTPLDFDGLSTASTSIAARDRTYGWNNVGGWAFLRWITDGHVPGGIGIPAYWWTWMSMSGGGPYQAEMACISSTEYPGQCLTGERGLTWHQYFPIVK